jgi:hypothetical protein
MYIPVINTNLAGVSSIFKNVFYFLLQDPCQPFIPFLKHQEEKYEDDFKNYD